MSSYQQWLALWRHFASGDGRVALARAVYDTLVRHYSATNRFYHNLQHVAEVLVHIDRLSSYCQHHHLVALAGWLHDIVYVPGADDNEVQSANLAASLLQPLALDPAQLAELRRLILLTASHRAAPGDGNGHVLLDADLAILGAVAARYDEYAAAIRREYAHLTPEQFRRGRAQLLRQMLERDFLYYTPPMRAEREGRARHNMERELAHL